MENKKGIYLAEKPLLLQLKIKLIADSAFAYLHQLELRKKVHYINKPQKQTPVIYALWHGYQWGLGLFTKEEREKIHILISKSNDGEIIARLCAHLGFGLIRGSWHRGGDTALREMISTLEKGENIAFTVDGPKGPNQKVKKGLIKLAKLSKAPIVPIIPYLKKKIVFNSWDKCQFPICLVPRASFIYGKPVYIPQDADAKTEQQYRKKIERYMFMLEKELEKEHKRYWGE